MKCSLEIIIFQLIYHFWFILMPPDFLNTSPIYIRFPSKTWQIVVCYNLDFWECDHWMLFGTGKKNLKIAANKKSYVLAKQNEYLLSETPSKLAGKSFFTISLWKYARSRRNCYARKYSVDFERKRKPLSLILGLTFAYSNRRIIVP